MFHWAAFDSTWLGSPHIWITSLGWAMTAAQIASTTVGLEGSMIPLSVAGTTGLPNVTLTAAAFVPASTTPGHLTLLASALPANKSVTTAINASFTIDPAVWHAHCPSPGHGATATELRLDRSRSPYDGMLAELQRIGGYPEFLTYNDNEVYLPTQMATAAGIAHLSQPAVVKDLIQMDRASVEPQAFGGVITATSDGGVQVQTMLVPPCALLIIIDCAQ